MGGGGVWPSGGSRCFQKSRWPLIIFSFNRRIHPPPPPLRSAPDWLDSVKMDYYTRGSPNSYMNSAVDSGTCNIYRSQVCMPPHTESSFSGSSVLVIAYILASVIHVGIISTCWGRCTYNRHTMVKGIVEFSFQPVKFLQPFIVIALTFIYAQF